MWSRLITVVEEMWSTVCRTAFSLIISESQDFACDLLDADGEETLAHSPRAMPVFNLTLPNAIKAMLKRPPRDAETRRRAGHQRPLDVRRPPVRHRRG